MPVSAWSQELLQLLDLGQAAVAELRVLRELGIPAPSCGEVLESSGQQV